MSLSDPIGDMLARIKNAQMRSQKKVELPSSKFKCKIAEVLKDEGFIVNFETTEISDKPILVIELKYNLGNLKLIFRILYLVNFLVLQKFHDSSRAYQTNLIVPITHAQWTL